MWRKTISIQLVFSTSDGEIVMRTLSYEDETDEINPVEQAMDVFSKWMKSGQMTAFAVEMRDEWKAKNPDFQGTFDVAAHVHAEGMRII